MTVSIANTLVTSTFDYWRNRTNELAYAMSTYAVTTNSSTAVGDTGITGTFTANVVVANTLVLNSYTSSITLGNTAANSTVNTTSIGFANTTANITISLPTAAQQSNGQYFLNANSSWVPLPSYVFGGNTTGTSAVLFDSFTLTQYLSAEYLIHVVDNNNTGNHHSTKVLISHNGTNTSFSTEYGTIYTTSSIGTFTTNVDSTTVRLFLTPISTNTSYRAVRIAV